VVGGSRAACALQQAAGGGAGQLLRRCAAHLGGSVVVSTISSATATAGMATSTNGRRQLVAGPTIDARPCPAAKPTPFAMATAADT
jgi:hypothetical protein